MNGKVMSVKPCVHVQIPNDFDFSKLPYEDRVYTINNYNPNKLKEITECFRDPNFTHASCLNTITLEKLFVTNLENLERFLNDGIDQDFVIMASFISKGETW